MLPKNKLLISIPFAVASLVAGCAEGTDDLDGVNVVISTEDVDDNEGSDTAVTIADMSFFLTSNGIGDGGNLGGLAGADAHCSNLAAAAGATATEWRAYLSTTGADGVNAIDRIGSGPWVNAIGVVVATDTADLLSDGSNLNGLTAITENGDTVTGRGNTPNRHDILTGTTLDGVASTEETDTTCGNWTSNADSVGAAIVGHHDRSGPLIEFVENPNSFSTAHPSLGCSQANLQATGGDGLLYCFVEN